MRGALFWSSAVCVALAIGASTAWVAVGRTGIGGSARSGSWVVEASVGSVNAGMYARARTAIHALMGLQKREALYYVATRDDEGLPLDGNCSYVLRGRDPDARWWSITAYGPDHFLIPNDAHAYSVARTTIRREAGGEFIVSVSPEERPRNWIPVQRGPFDLMVRLYGPSAQVQLDPSTAALPGITKEGCR